MAHTDESQLSLICWLRGQTGRGQARARSTLMTDTVEKSQLLSSVTFDNGIFWVSSACCSRLTHSWVLTLQAWTRACRVARWSGVLGLKVLYNSGEMEFDALAFVS